MAASGEAVSTSAEAQPMDLARGAANLRPRGPWQAIDFGFSLAREHYFQLVLTSSLIVLPIAALLAIAFSAQIAWLALFVWWLKPVWERVHLFVLSRSLFGARPSIRETLRAFPETARVDLLPWLTFRRLSPTRSFDLPVTLLEGSKGRERGRRLSVLHRGRFTGAGIMLTMLLAHMELALLLAGVVLLQLLVPDLLDLDISGWAWGLDDDAAPGGAIFTYFLGIIVSLLVAPFYIAGGFALYLHRRTVLEAWDLELAFRRLASHAPRAAVRTRRGSVSLLLALAVAGAGLPIAPPALAEGLDPSGAREAIEEVLSGEEFHVVETVSIPRFILDQELTDDEEEESGDFAAWLIGLANAMAGGFEVMLVSLALVFFGWLVFRIASQSDSWRGVGSLRGPTRRPPGPVELFGLEVTEESLPEDLVAQARSMVTAGDVRGALALLYRGALSRLGLLYGAEFPASVTERECVEAVQTLLPESGLAYFQQLTSVWVRCAYGHLEPDSTRLEALCFEWESWFAPAGEAADTDATSGTHGGDHAR